MAPPTGSVLAVDPGIRAAGVAWFNELGKLVRADLVRNPVKKGGGPGAAGCLAREIARLYPANLCGTLVVEFPQVYRVAKQKGDQNDLLGLAAVDGALSALYPVCTHYLPREWKGQLPKHGVVEGRVKARLSPEEMERVHPNGALSHNVFDAIGIGLHYLGRFKSERVIAY